jgi:hypothetical protein
MHDLPGAALSSSRQVQNRSVACPYMSVGMKVCGLKVLSAVSVTVRHSLAGDRNEGTSCISLEGSNKRVLISPSSRCPGDVALIIDEVLQTDN